MPVVQFEISDKLLRRLQAIIPGDETVDQLASFALEEWIAWLEGSLRPISIPELETYRVFIIYSQLLKTGLPSADHLGELLKLPIGRSRYIIQNLGYRYGNLLMQRQIQAIAQALSNGQWSDDKKTCIVHIDRTCKTIIDRAIQELEADGKLKSVVRGVITMEGVRYDLGANHHSTLTSYFAAYINND